MAVVRNLMIRIGADYSPAKKSMDGATRELTRFRRDTERTTRTIRGSKGLGGISTEYKNLGRELTASLSRLRGAKGIGGVASELGTLAPLLGKSSTAMRGLGTAATGTGGRLAAMAGPIGIVAAGLAAIVAVSAAASQEAVRYEATIGRLNMQLKEGSRDFMTWARSMGLAKQTAADMGATYGTLLSSFISDNRELQEQTKAITQATRVTASATGRTLDDVLERMRSGLLGNTEAIEDLGIFVNISMIESTQAFRKFAGDKSWAQLDFQTQQQIRLAAILEQAYARYGNELQRNTMTKQTLLLEQLKDIKLNLSQAFLPIYDAVLPALTRLTAAVADITEQIARFIYTLRGWDYDAMTSGTDQATGAIDNQTGALEDLAKQAKAARKELAAFDEINQLGGNDGAGTGGSGGGSGGPGLGGMPTGPGLGSGNGIQWPDLPTIPELKYKLTFEPPTPPDAGAGAVATAVTSTVDGMIADNNAKLSGMWANLRSFGLAEAAGQQLGWADMWKQMVVTTTANTPIIQNLVASMFTGIGLASNVTTTGVSLDWRTMLTGMLEDLTTYQVPIIDGWGSLKLEIESIKNPLATARAEWHAALDEMQVKLNAYRPYLEWGWHLLGVSVLNLALPLAETKAAWSVTLTDMYNTAAAKLGAMVDRINAVTTAWLQMQQVLTGRSASFAPAPSPSPSAAPAASGAGAVAPAPSPLMPDTKSFFESFADSMQYTFSGENLANMWQGIQNEAAKPQNQIAATIYSTLLPLGKLGGLAKYGDDALKGLQKFLDGLKGAGNAIPAFAKGAAVYGPTLAMVGDNPGARTDPELIAPQSDVVDAIHDAVASAFAMMQPGQASQQTREVVIQLDGKELARVAYPYFDAEQNRRGGTMIRTT